MNAAAYTRLVRQLLPTGAAWAGEVLAKFAQAVGDELARIDARAANVIEERDPRTAMEMLPEWEREVGLPDPCVADWGALTTTQRRAAVVARLTAVNSQSRQFFLDLAATLGYSPAVVTYRPFQVGRSCVGERLSNGGWVHAMTISGDGADAEELQCAIAAKTHAQIVLLFDP